MRFQFLKYFLLSLLPASFFGCQQFHDTSARYNAWFLADERMTQAEYKMVDQIPIDYNDILQVLPYIDSNSTKPYAADMEYVIDMASKPIQWHKTSEWVDDSYLLVGKARMYKGDFPNAINTFKYLNSQAYSDEVKHAALISLLRIFISTGNYNNLKVVQQAINSETGTFTKENTRDYHLAMAHYYREKEEFEFALEHLRLAVPLLDRRTEKARLSFLLGQLERYYNNEGAALRAFENAIDYAPTFDMEFQSKSSAMGLENPKDAEEDEKLNKKFNRMLDDLLYYNLKDKLYYELARLSLKKGDLDQGIDYLTKSTEWSLDNPVQKGYSFLKLGELAYDTLKDFTRAADYYKKAVESLNDKVRNYDRYANRAEVLGRFAVAYEEVRQADLLLNLSNLPEDSIDVILNRELEAEKETIIKEAAFNKQTEARKKLAPNLTSGLPGGKTAGGASTWYFNSSEAITKGSAEFLRQWGNRPLQDNWRTQSRMVKTLNAGGAQQGDIDGALSNTLDAGNVGPGGRVNDESTADPFGKLKSVEQRRAEIPKAPEEFVAVHDRLRGGLDELGRIYRFDLHEYGHAEETFDRFLAEYDTAETAPEVAYIGYKLCEEEGVCNKEKYLTFLRENYPDNFYARVLINPEGLVREKAQNEQIDFEYAQAYNLYKAGLYDSTLVEIARMKRVYPEATIKDKLDLLVVMSRGRLVKTYTEYHQAIIDWKLQYPESELMPFANKLANSISEEMLDVETIHHRKDYILNAKLPVTEE